MIAALNIPNELKQLTQFVSVDNKDKLPKCAGTNLCASVSDPSTWATYDAVIDAVKSGKNDAIGFVFTPDDNYVGIDIDDGIDDDGFITPLAAELIGHFQSYTEKSRSGRGFHIIVKGKLPFDGRNNRHGLEMYSCKRYFILTGEVFIHQNIVCAGDKLKEIVDKYFDTPVEHEDGKCTSYKIYEPTWEDTKLRLHPNYPPVLNGSRNVSLLSLAGSLREQGYSFADMVKELQYVNKHACDEPLPAHELTNICHSAMRYKKEATA